MTERPFPPVEGVEHHFADVDGVRLHYAEAGARDADPVVLLHGWPEHWYAWRRVIPLLAGDFRVIAPDLRGFGWSDAPDSAYTKPELARDISGLLKALDLRDVRLAGHDWGGLVAFLVALEVPERLRSVLSVCMVHPWARGRPAPSAILIGLAYQPIMAAPILGPAVQRFTPFVDLWFGASGGDRTWSPQERRAFTDSFREPARARAASRVYRTFLTRELVGGVGVRGKRLEVPGRLLLGRSDPIVTARLNQPVPPGVELEVVPGGHFLPEEQPELVADRIR